MTRQEKLSVFNAALTGLLAGWNDEDHDVKEIVREAARIVRTTDTSTACYDAFLTTSDDPHAAEMRFN